ncbi:hypothetical protein GCM10023318_16950 [Nocardia callitridis]|uniref:Uncharacterized protein n=1 Tax=Nocardia callitridis TaxID=648753 RepID=A0ABP9K3A2_9NOCA
MEQVRAPLPRDQVGIGVIRHCYSLAGKIAESGRSVGHRRIPLPSAHRLAPPTSVLSRRFTDSIDGREVGVIRLARLRVAADEPDEQARDTAAATRCGHLWWRSE